MSIASFDGSIPAIIPRSEHVTAYPEVTSKIELFLDSQPSHQKLSLDFPAFAL
jgi:hypothetical protein